MAKVEIVSDRIEVEKQRLLIELSIPLDFLKEAIKNPETIKKTFAVAFAEAMDDFLTKKQLQK